MLIVTCVMYADDTTLLFESSNSASLQLHMNDSLSKMAHCFKANKLTLNIKKTICFLAQITL